MRKLILILTSLVLCSSIGFGQRLITGKIINDQKEAQPAVNVQIKNKPIGTISNLDGTYSISANSGDTLVFSMVGMVLQKIPVGNRSVIDVVLLTDIKLMDEIVVIGYGTVKKSDLTGSVGSIKGAEIVKVTSFDPVQGLQGKAAGVQITSTSGAPGALASIRIRGVGTFNNASPIFVVDGVITDDISFLNTADIASMEVLKDASATAIYGSRGANGVILVTTKLGKVGGEKATFNYSGEAGMQKLTKKIDLLTGPEFALVKNRIVPGSYGNPDLVNNTDWQSLIFHTAPIQNHQLSATGSTKSTQYYVGLSYFKQEGIIDKSSYERVTFMINNTYNLTEGIKLGTNINVSPTKGQSGPNVVTTAYRARPDLRPYYDDGSYAVVYNVGNPLADLAASNSYSSGVRAVGNIFAEVNFFKMFTFKSSFGMDASYNKGWGFMPAYTVYLPLSTGTGYLPDYNLPTAQNNALNFLSKSSSEGQVWLWENTLSFNKTIGIHAIDAVVGYTAQNADGEAMGMSGQGIIRDTKDMWYLNSASYFYDPSRGINTIGNLFNYKGNFYSMISFLGRVNYALNGKYIFTGTFRRDGSSKFGSSNRYGNFPSFALGWNVYKEDFMKSLPLISNLKVRLSWGIIGNEKIPYTSQYSLTSSQSAVFGTTPTLNPGTTYDLSGNPDLKWESTAQTDIGLEVGLYKNKLTGEFDYYRRLTSDILLSLSTPAHLGNGTGAMVYFNAASVLNRGYEFKIDWKDKVHDFNYSVGIVGTFIHNEVLTIGGSQSNDSTLLGGGIGGNYVTQSRVGLPIGAFYGYKVDGVFQSTEEINSYPHLASAVPGDLKFVDVSGDGHIDGNDRTYIGSPIPTFICGLSLYSQFKGFDLAVDIQGQMGNKIFNGKETVRPDEYNYEKHVLYSWTGPGTSNTEPRATIGGDANYLPSERFIFDGSFIRLRSLILGYTLPSSITKKISIKQLRVYAKGNNIYTLSKYTGYTPEIGSGDVLSNGLDSGIYPVCAIYSFGINLTF
jgi:TonB-linked SusC/RagA family outer membrane protein